MKINGLFLRAALLFAITVGPAFGTLISAQSPLNLQQAADLIVVGTASGVARSGAAVNVPLFVTRVLKGDSALAGKTILAVWTPAAGTTQAAPASITGGIWFLLASSNGWVVLPVVQGDIPFTMTYFPAQPGPILGTYAYEGSAALSVKLAAELGSAIEGSAGTYNFQLDVLQSGSLDQLASPFTHLLYSRLSASGLPAQYLLGLAGLIRGGDAASLSSAVKAESAFPDNAKENGILLSSIRDHFRATDAVSISVLGQAATNANNQNAQMREALAHALAAIHSAATLPYLAALLTDQNANLRVEAVGGIASFANGLAMQTSGGVPALAYLQLPAHAPYMTAETRANFALGSQAIERNEPAYISFWTQWWLQNRASLGF